jgi:DNA-binding transcriptional LysR family regulator
MGFVRMDRLLSMRVFQQVIDTGGFAAAARALNMSPATVTRLVTDLEQHLGARLVQRTTRKLSLTEAGDAYLLRLRNIMHEIEDAEASAAADTQALKGTLHLVATPAIATLLLAPGIARWRERHPKVAIDLAIDLTPERHIDEFDATFMVMNEGYDANVVARPLVATEWVLCAAPSLLKRTGVPAKPQDLAGHDFLRYTQHHATTSAAGRVRLQSVADVAGGGETVDVDMNPVLHTPSMDVLLRTAMDGTGYGVFSKLLARRHLLDGSLVQVLPAWHLGRFSIYVALPSRKLIPARTRVFVDFVVEMVGDVRRARGNAG